MGVMSTSGGALIVECGFFGLVIRVHVCRAEGRLKACAMMLCGLAGGVNLPSDRNRGTRWPRPRATW